MEIFFLRKCFELVAFDSMAEWDTIWYMIDVYGTLTTQALSTRALPSMSSSSAFHDPQ